MPRASRRTPTPIRNHRAGLSFFSGFPTGLAFRAMYSLARTRIDIAWDRIIPFLVSYYSHAVSD